jgi:hypothetical protein
LIWGSISRVLTEANDEGDECHGEQDPVNRGEESSSSKCAVNSRRRTGNVAIGPIGIDHAPVHNTCPGRCPGRRPGKRGPTAQPPNLEEDFENQDWNVMVETWSKSSADNVPGTDYDGNEGHKDGITCSTKIVVTMKQPDRCGRQDEHKDRHDNLSNTKDKEVGGNLDDMLVIHDAGVSYRLVSVSSWMLSGENIRVLFFYY